MRPYQYDMFGDVPLLTYTTSTNPAAQVQTQLPPVARSGPSMGTLVVLGLVGIGGYLLYRKMRKKAA